MGRMPKDKKIQFSGFISARRWRGVMSMQIQFRVQHLHNMPQIARTLKRDARDVYHHILALRDLNPLTDPEATYTRLLPKLLTYATTLHYWERSLSVNPRFLVQLDWSILNFDKHVHIRPLLGYSDLIVGIIRKPDNIHFPLSPDEAALLQQCRLKAKRISQYIRLMRQFTLKSTGQMSAVSPHFIARIMWCHLAFSRRFPCIALLPKPLPQIPDVQYAPIDLHSVANSLFWFGREDVEDDVVSDEVYLHLRRGEHGAEFCLTIKHYILMPGAWEQVSRAFGDIREAGGSIEPFTQDEGYGQGVIVQLPWAKGEV